MIPRKRDIWEGLLVIGPKIYKANKSILWLQLCIILPFIYSQPGILRFSATVVLEDYIAKTLNLQIINRKGDTLAWWKQADLVPWHAQKPWVPLPYAPLLPEELKFKKKKKKKLY